MVRANGTARIRTHSFFGMLIQECRRWIYRAWRTRWWSSESVICRYWKPNCAPRVIDNSVVSSRNICEIPMNLSTEDDVILSKQKGSDRGNWMTNGHWEKKPSNSVPKWKKNTAITPQYNNSWNQQRNYEGCNHELSRLANKAIAAQREFRCYKNKGLVMLQIKER